MFRISGNFYSNVNQAVEDLGGSPRGLRSCVRRATNLERPFMWKGRTVEIVDAKDRLQRVGEVYYGALSPQERVKIATGYYHLFWHRIDVEDADRHLSDLNPLVAIFDSRSLTNWDRITTYLLDDPSEAVEHLERYSNHPEVIGMRLNGECIEGITKLTETVGATEQSLVMRMRRKMYLDRDIKYMGHTVTLTPLCEISSSESRVTYRGNTELTIDALWEVARHLVSRSDIAALENIEHKTILTRRAHNFMVERIPVPTSPLKVLQKAIRYREDLESLGIV